MGYVLVALAIYCATLAPSITWRFSGADSGDLASAVATWGVPHPTGYPLYVLLGGVMTRLVPFGQPAFRLNVLSAACSALAGGFVFLTVLCAGRRMPELPSPLRAGIATTAALAFATSRTPWSQSVLTEVYALETFLAAAILGLVADPQPSRRRLIVLTFLCGLALTHHETIVFSLLGALAAVALRSRRWPSAKQVVAGIALFAAPLLLYLLPWRASHRPASNWGDPEALARFVDVVTGAPYH
jgi:hypothetical protein